MKLSDKQEKFCQEYLKDLNATQAAIRSGYSKKTSQEIGSHNLSALIIQERLSELKEIRAKKEGITAEQVLKELRNFAYSDITETLQLTVEQIKELPAEIRRLITQYKKVTTRLGDDGEIIQEVIELKFIDKMKAFEMLNKHIGFYEADNKQSTPDLGKITSIKIVRPDDGA